MFSSIALVVHDGEFRRIEKAAAVQPVGRDEVSPLLASVAEVRIPTSGGAETAVGGRDADPWGVVMSLTRARGDVDDHAGLFAEFGRRRAGDDFHGLDRIERNLVGKDFALLVGDRLAIDGERVLRVIAHAVEETVGIGGNSRRGQRDQRTH